MKHCLGSLLILVSMCVADFANSLELESKHPLAGSWQLDVEGLHCGELRAPGQRLQPLGSEIPFSPDIRMTYTPLTQIQAMPELGLHTEDGFFVQSKKSLTTASCTNPELQALHRPLYQQNYIQRVHFNLTSATKGFITGMALGEPTGLEDQSGNEDCAPLLPLFSKFFLKSHVQKELHRIYQFEIINDQFVLSFKDEGFENLCHEGETTFLVFQRVQE